MKTLILGLGNSILSDDAVGLHVARELKSRLTRSDVTVMETELGGINLLELLAGYDKAILVDAINHPDLIPGKIYQLSPDSLQGTRHTDSTHSSDFPTLIKLGKQIGLDLPEEIVILAIGASEINAFSEDCTPVVNNAIPLCVDKIIQML